MGGKVHFLYRAIGEDGISRLGYAVSRDGFTIDERLSSPVYEHRNGDRKFNVYSYFSGGSFGGAEDPRLIRVDNEDVLYMTYTACDNGLRVGLTSIKVDDFINKKWKWRLPTLISPPDEVHKNWVIFPEKIEVTDNEVLSGGKRQVTLENRHTLPSRNVFRKLLDWLHGRPSSSFTSMKGQDFQLAKQIMNSKYAILHSISPKISVAYRDSLEFQEGEYIQSYYNGNGRRKNCWDSWVRGAGAPPLKTTRGWLLLYHAIDESDSSKYKVGAMLLDFHDATKILYRSQEPILEPEEDYENDGFKRGIIYVSGAVIKDGELLVYYGASDSYIGVAHANVEEFIEALTKGIKPKLKAKALKKRKI